MSMAAEQFGDELIERFSLKALIECCLVLEDGVGSMREIDLGLLLGAAVLDQLRDLQIWLGRDRSEDRFADWRPDRLLTGLLETEGGYLAPTLT